jgi:hypothetical protein
MNNDQRDEQIWRIAKKRAAFKNSLIAYVIVNTFLVAVWYFTSGSGLPFWPRWPIFGWGLAMLFQYFDAYHGGALFSAQEEYQRLRRDKGQ